MRGCDVVENQRRWRQTLLQAARRRRRSGAYGHPGDHRRCQQRPDRCPRDRRCNAGTDSSATTLLAPRGCGVMTGLLRCTNAFSGGMSASASHQTASIASAPPGSHGPSRAGLAVRPDMEKLAFSPAKIRTERISASACLQPLRRAVGLRQQQVSAPGCIQR